MKKNLLAVIFGISFILSGTAAFSQDEISAKKFSGVTFVSFKTRLSYKAKTLPLTLLQEHSNLLQLINTKHATAFGIRQELKPKKSDTFL